jgi:bacterial/archaeal transporter family protein
MDWLLYAALSAVLAGLVTIFGKLGVHGVDNTVATTVRAAIMCAVLVLIVLVRGAVPNVRTLDGRTLLFLVLSGLAGAGSWLCYFRALQLGDALRVQDDRDETHTDAEQELHRQQATPQSGEAHDLTIRRHGPWPR